MANKRTLAITFEQYKVIINNIQNGFITKDGRIFKPNHRISTILVVQANLGLRIGDILNLKMTSFVKDGDRFRLDIIESKTKKKRVFTVPTQIYNYIKIYSLENKIGDNRKLFDISDRAVQKQLRIVCDTFGLEGIGTHSFRKYFATQIYVNSNYNIQLVSQLLQHGSITTTQKYIGIQQKDVEDALNNHVYLL